MPPAQNTPATKVKPWQVVVYIIAVLFHLATLILLPLYNGLAVMQSDSCVAPGIVFYCVWWGGVYFIFNALALLVSYLLLVILLAKKGVNTWLKALAIALLPAANLLLLFVEVFLVQK